MSLPSWADYVAALGNVFSGIATLFLLALLGWLAVRRKILSDAGVDGVTRLLVDLVVPAKIITAFLAGLDGRTLDKVGAVVLAMLVLLGFGLAVAWLATRLWRGKRAAEDRALLALSASQNGVYLPLPLMLAITPAALHNEATILIGGVFLVLAATQWTLVVCLLRGEAERDAARENWRAALLAPLNGPVLGVLVGCLLAFFPPLADAARSDAPPPWLAVPLGAATLLGDAMPPLAMIVLGMMIGRCEVRGSLSWRDVVVPCAVRFVLTPLLFVWMLGWGPFEWASPLMAVALIIQAAAPPGTNLSLIARRYGGDWETVSSVLLVTYTVGLFVVPAWAALFMPALGE